MSVERELQAVELAERARTASRALSRASAEQRARALQLFARELESPRVATAIEAANAADLRAAAGESAAFLDRLRLDGQRLKDVARAVREVSALPDPVGEVVERTTRPNGLSVERVRSPLGVVLIIYESRPGVTADAAALCLRSGNAVLLRGGSEALQSNSVLVDAFQRALEEAGLPEDAVQLVPPDRALLETLLQQEERIDLCIPRGGTSLIRFVAQQSRIPVVKHYQGVCHLYVAADADLAQAESIAVNAKAQRPGVCNALECLLVDAGIAAQALPRLGRALQAAGVELRADPRALPWLPGARPAVPDDFGREFLDLKLAVAVVDGVEGALGHIARYGSRHTEAICTRDQRLAERFVREVDASCALVNASTRFNDGGELGLGAEIGISTSKLHAYGPMGLRELTCTRFVVRGDGQVRT
ncbi:MAG TPA: glutamate-5-semialdehyde dehydrogenase [Myxococcales bacterium]|nr:glutamate-5-semialdehyde dehydrogenase [Myxococcales bacterium]